MAGNIARVKVVYSGFTGGPGLGQFYFTGASPGAFNTSDATAAIAAVRAFCNSTRATWSSGMTAQVQPTVELVDSTNGQLVGLFTGTGVTIVTSGGSGTTLPATGQLVQWMSSTVVGRRLLRGRTFITPSCSNAMDGSGVVNATQVAAAGAAAAALIATTPQTFVLWHRPKPFKTGNNGSYAPVVGYGTPSKVAVLKSRRD